MAFTRMFSFLSLCLVTLNQPEINSNDDGQRHALGKDFTTILCLSKLSQLCNRLAVVQATRLLLLLIVFVLLWLTTRLITVKIDRALLL